MGNLMDNFCNRSRVLHNLVCMVAHAMSPLQYMKPKATGAPALVDAVGLDVKNVSIYLLFTFSYTKF